MQNTIKIEDIKFQTSFHGNKRNLPEGTNTKRLKQKLSLDLSAEQKSLILMPNHGSSIPKLNDEPIETKVSTKLLADKVGHFIPNPKLSSKIHKNSSSSKQRKIKINLDPIQIETVSNRQRYGRNKSKQKSYQEIINKLIEQSPKNQSFQLKEAVPQKILTHKLKFDKMKEYLKINRNMMLSRREQSQRKRNSCSLPSISHLQVGQEKYKIGQSTWVKNFVFLQDISQQIQTQTPSLKRNLEGNYNPIHERQNKKLAIEKALKKRKQTIKLQRPHTQLQSQPVQMMLISDKKKLAKKYEESLKVHYDRLMQIYQKSDRP